MSPNSVTIRDVAKHAGVSHQTVSRVINDADNVAPETRARVLLSIQELNYQPNVFARSMATGRSQTLACISPNLTDFTFARIIEGAETECRKLGYFLVSTSAPDEETFTSLLDELVRARRTEGLLVMNPFADNRHELIGGVEPMVYVGARPRQEAANSVALDDVTTGKEATEHLISLGHECIGMVTGPMEEDCTQDRQAGFQAALLEAGLEFDPALIAEGDWSASSGYEAFKRISRKGNCPTAIFAQNDQMAIGAIQAAREMGISVPGDLSIIGVDNMPLSSYYDPPLTTMGQDLIEIGRNAARILVEALEKKTAKKQILVKPELIVRGSTAPLEKGRVQEV